MFPSSHSLRARPQRRSASCIFSYNAGLGSLFGPRAGRPSLASCGNSQASVSLGAPPALPRCPHASLEPDPSLDTMRAHATRTGQGHTGIRTHVLGARVWISHRHEPTSICPWGGALTAAASQSWPGPAPQDSRTANLSPVHQRLNLSRREAGRRWPPAQEGRLLPFQAGPGVWTSTDLGLSPGGIILCQPGGGGGQSPHLWEIGWSSVLGA